MKVDLVLTGENDKPVLANLLQLYLHDFAEIRFAALTPHGTYTYNYLDPYFTESATREAYLIMADGELVGFAMARCDVDNDGSWNVAEFFVVRARRRNGIAREAATLLFARHPGTWTLNYDHVNKPAVAFWRSMAADLVAETELPDARTRLRFRAGR
ncbi:GNAT family N-acetyltransferase [Actinosynnema sp. ALI-1.44]|uniref:GNAT family N-acetyltransferase n=1 Tax=Actinosynnema sp. ALI-1.44 TaxID=1933779 RepID=UPI00097C483F|nr:GNAT family N-acetyltransferase [Actinosynnema sp. ALI-1.44]ONI74928.1 GNAT family N-acetyltransferase [Actinosynnema sp. ALI-1.44]